MLKQAGWHPVTVRKALSFSGDGMFGLLVMMTALLGWLVALGVGGALVMQNVYGNWQLSRQETMMVYLPPDTDNAAVVRLVQNLTPMTGVKQAAQVAPDTVKEWLAPYLPTGGGLPLPVVLEVGVKADSDRAMLTQLVQSKFPTAEIDDAQTVLQTVARGVRAVQAVGLGLVLITAAVMLLLVVLAVRAGLRGQRHTLALMQQLGATDKLVVTTVAGQVGSRCIAGWLVASSVALMCMLVTVLAWPTLRPFVDAKVWVGIAFGPLWLPLVAWLTARMVAAKVVVERWI